MILKLQKEEKLKVSKHYGKTCLRFLGRHLTRKRRGAINNYILQLFPFIKIELPGFHYEPQSIKEIPSKIESSYNTD